MRNLEIEEILRKRGIKYSYEAEVPVELLDRDQAYQVRYLPDGKVNEADARRLTELLRAGVDLGPVVLMKAPSGRYLIIEGNTRRESHLRAKRPSTAAYVVDLSSARQARTLSLQLNQRHGTRMKKFEVQQYFESLNGETPSTDELIKITGYSKSSLEQMVWAGKFKARCEKAGIQLTRPPSQGAMAWIAHISLSSVFREAALLSSDARLSDREAREISRKVASFETEGEQLAFVAQCREGFRERIDDLKFGFRERSSSPARQIALHAGWFRNALAEGGMNDTDPASRQQSQERLQEAASAIRQGLEQFYGASATA